jgi:hypothetical protein
VKSKSVAQKARDVLNTTKKHNAKTLVKLVCEYAVVAAELKFVGITIPMDYNLDIIDDVIEALEKHGFRVIRQGNRLVVAWTDAPEQNLVF